MLAKTLSGLSSVEIPRLRKDKRGVKAGCLFIPLVITRTKHHLKLLCD